MNHVYQSATPHIQLKDKVEKLRQEYGKRKGQKKRKKIQKATNYPQNGDFKSDNMTLKSAKGIGF